MKLSKTERLVLSNQYRILEALYPDEAADYERQRAIVERGYKFEYSRLFHSVDDEVPESTSKHVLDVLDMYRVITSSNARLKKADRLPANEVGLPGFDGNHEVNELSYARYFTADGDKYAELTNAGKSAIPNSHSQTRDRYARMLRAWKASADPNNLTREDLDRILGSSRSRA